MAEIQYIGIVAAFAMGADASTVDEAWELARQVSVEIPDDLELACRTVAGRARAHLSG